MPSYHELFIVDLELTCHPDGEEPLGWHPEIIQVGWTKLHMESFTLSPPVSVFIKPEGKISEFCTNLTGITYKQVKSGIPWRDACKYIMRNFGTRKYPWAGWGDDNLAVDAECLRTDSRSPFNEKYIDLSALYGFTFNNSRSTSLGRAAEHLNTDFCRPAHNAANDALTTAHIAQKLFSYMRKAEDTEE